MTTPQPDLDTYDGILAAFAPDVLARGLALKNAEHARVLKHRRHIPAKYWPELIDLAQSAGVAVGPDNLGRAELAFQMRKRRDAGEPLLPLGAKGAA